MSLSFIIALQYYSLSINTLSWLLCAAPWTMGGSDPGLEAASGAVGALFTGVLMYPVETAKTMIQTGQSKESTTNTMITIARSHGVSRLFKGLSIKSVHVVLQNYLYFYFYELLKAQRKAMGMRTSTLSNTVCGVLAGVGNMTVTLPLDTLVVQLQTSDGKSKRLPDLVAALMAKGRSGIYRGFGVSSILTLNPALTFALFDALKARVMRLLKTKRLSTLQAFVIGSLAKAIATVLTYPLIRTKSVMQRGAAEATATQKAAATHPVRHETGHGVGLSDRHGSHCGSNGGSYDSSSSHRPDRGASGSPRTVSVEPPGMLQVLLSIWQAEGLDGLFRGCSAQIFTAVCKSGVLLTTKERIATFALGVLVLCGRRPRQQLAA